MSIVMATYGNSHQLVRWVQKETLNCSTNSNSETIHTSECCWSKFSSMRFSVFCPKPGLSKLRLAFRLWLCGIFGRRIFFPWKELFQRSGDDLLPRRVGDVCVLARVANLRFEKEILKIQNCKRPIRGFDARQRSQIHHSSADNSTLYGHLYPGVRPMMTYCFRVGASATPDESAPLVDICCHRCLGFCTFN